MTLRMPRGRMLATLVLFAALPPAFAPAHADGIVIRSTSPAYARGAHVSPGQELRLTQGEEIVVLDQSGEKITIAATGAYKPGAAATGGAGAPSAQQVKAEALKNAFLATLPVGSGPVSSQEGCISAAGNGGSLSEAGCRIAFPTAAGKTAKPVNPHVTVEMATEAREIAPHAVAPLVVSTSFDAAVACSLGSPAFAGANAEIPLSLAGSSVWFTLHPKGDGKDADTDYAAPAPDKPGEYKVMCRAVDPETWRLANDAAGDMLFGDFIAVLRQYAGVRGTSFAEDTVEFTVAN